ncbi:MAG: FAD-binding oxidoreductase [Dehalococcoidales bacterium]|nr:FAD-binding oxidoreductase [Dehalococcoidales bacterium]
MLETKDALMKIFVKEQVVDDPEMLEAYARDESFVHPLKPRAIVKPENAVQIADLVRWAGETDTPLVPVSSAGPHFRGDTVPSSPGAIMVDLSGMKKIIHIDVHNRMIIIEPGVTYDEIQPELAKHGLRLSAPLKPKSGKSVIASLLEKEPIMIPRYQWTPQDPLRCLEITWGDGQTMTTGEAGSLGNLEEEWAKKLAQVSPTGPAQTDFARIALAAQGSMGIVSWASIKCELLPSIHKLYFIPAKKPEDLVDLAYAILRIRFGDELMIMNNWNLASILAGESSQVKKLASQLPLWVLLVGIAGRERLPEERVAFQEKDISEMAQRFGLELVPAVPGASGAEVLRSILSSSEVPYWKQRYKGAFKDLFFLNTLEKAPRFIQCMYNVAESRGYPTSEIGIYLQPSHQGANCHIEFDLYYDPQNTRERDRMKELCTLASEELLKEGAYYSRPYGIWADMAFNRDAQSTRVLKKIKGIFDPKNVMNPGKLCF